MTRGTLPGIDEHTPSHPAAAVFPLLNEDDLAALGDDIKANGLREPITIIKIDKAWHVLDGRNRLRACALAGVEPQVEPYEGNDPVGFVISANLARRHLSESQRAMCAAKLSTLRQGRPSKSRKSADLDQSSAARLFGTSERSVQHARAVLDKGAVDVVRAVERDEIAVSAAAELVKLPKAKQLEVLARSSGKAGNVRALVRQVEKRETAQRIAERPLAAPEGPFDVIVADPPWKYEKRAGDATHRGDLPYPPMDLAAICALPVPAMASENAILWLWTTNAFMRHAYTVLDNWGFEEKTILTWVKDRMGLGDWLRGQTEHCILAVRGKPLVTLTNETTVLHGPLREHSRKPDQFYELVEKLCPGSKLEIFARTRREGWQGWGAEAAKFDAAE